MTTNQVFDRALFRARLSRVASCIESHDFLLRHASAEIVDRLGAVNRSFEVCADLSAYHGTLGRALTERYPAMKIASFSAVLPLAKCCKPPRAVADDETLPLADASIDLAVSALGLHLVNDLPGAFIQIRRALRPEGLVTGCCLGGDSLTELRQSLIEAETETMGGVSPRVLPTANVRDIGGLLQRAGFVRCVADVETLKILYPSPLALRRDLKAMGCNNALTARSKVPIGRATWTQAQSIYRKKHSERGGQVKATFELIYFLAWKS